MKYSKKIVIAAISAVVAFWIAEGILLAAYGQSYPDVFTRCWFTFWSIEVTALAGIKITETRTNPYSGSQDIGG